MKEVSFDEMREEIIKSVVETLLPEDLADLCNRRVLAKDGSKYRVKNAAALKKLPEQVASQMKFKAQKDGSYLLTFQTVPESMAAKIRKLRGLKHESRDS